MTARRGAGRTGLLAGVAGVLVILGLGLGVYSSKFAGSDAPEAGASSSGAAGPMTEVDRRAYIQAHVHLDALELGPDVKPGDGGVVPGLLRVSGVVRNAGPRALSEAHLGVYPHDARGEVISSFVEEILDGRALQSGEARNFIFRIPARPEYTGTFDHRLR